MGLLDSLKTILGVTPVSIGELNRQATHASARNIPVAPKPDPLEGIEVTEEYRLVSEMLDSGFPIVFVSGKAGTGKSTLIHYLRHATKKNAVVVAPTGVAALNVRGATIHSFFRFPPRILQDDDIEQVRDRRLYLKLDLLIVDEISMVRADVIDGMDRFLRLNGRDENAPFGGTQLLLVGDLFQLPPVVTKAEETVLFSRNYESPYFFSAKALEHCQMAPIELGKVFRQRDPEFTDLLNKVRVAEELAPTLSTINSACAVPCDSTDQIIALTCTNAAADRENQQRLDRLPGEARTFLGEVKGKLNIEEERLPAPLNLALKPGAQVMFTKNDSQKRWVNGTIGRVHALLENSIQVELITDHPGTRHEVGREKWESYRYKYDYTQDRIHMEVVGEYIQFPLMLAWAVTIHKSQGKTLEKVRVDLGTGAFAPGQVYVALSRCRSLQDIRLVRPIQASEVKCDPRIKRFYQAMAGDSTPMDSDSVTTPAAPEGDPPPEICPSCGGNLRTRTGRYGPFLGCSNYPSCKFTRNP
jgi:hypothetical protein